MNNSCNYTVSDCIYSFWFSRLILIDFGNLPLVPWLIRVNAFELVCGCDRWFRVKPASRNAWECVRIWVADDWRHGEHWDIFRGAQLTMLVTRYIDTQKYYTYIYIYIIIHIYMYVISCYICTIEDGFMGRIVICNLWSIFDCGNLDEPIV